MKITHFIWIFSVIFHWNLNQTKLCILKNRKFTPLPFRDIDSAQNIRFLLPWNSNFSPQIKYCNTIRNKNQNKGSIRSLFNDPEIYKQWYFVRNENNFAYLSHGLNTVWERGITGTGVNIGVVAGGIEYEHRDLKYNYNPSLSYNFINKTNCISNVDNSVEIRSIGLISAVSDNHICGVGAAPSSKFSSLQIINNGLEEIEKNIMADAIIYQLNRIQIYLILLDDYHGLDIRRFIKNSITLSFKFGYVNGREGLGSIFIIGTGNLKKKSNNCAFHSILQMEETLVFGSITYNGTSPESAEECSAVLAASLSTEWKSESGSLYSTSSGHRCIYSADGSHAATSISAGIIALLISINQKLSVRQIMFLIILTSFQYDISAIKNNAGYYYSYSFGFGMLNAEGLIDLSLLPDINYIPPENICTSNVFNQKIRIARYSKYTMYIYSSGCLYTSYCITEIEKTFVVFSILTHDRSSINLLLTSPHGTTLRVISPRYYDNSHNGFHRWTVKLMGFFGENPLGVWKLEINTLKSSARFLNVELKFHGTCLHSNINVDSHNRVKNEICSTFSDSASFFIERLCDPYTVYRTDQEGDSFSFTNTEYENIMNLNLFIYPFI